MPSLLLRRTFVFLIAGFISACGLLPPSATATPAPPTVTPTPVGPQTLNICIANEPASLYLYADSSAAAQAVRQAIYDGPFDMQNNEPQAVILESVPRLDTSGAVLQSVTVRQGDTVVDASGQVRVLGSGVRVLPSGCKDGNCAVDYPGGELQMDQLVVTFTLRSGLTWDDGTPLTSSDSVYSFELASDQATPGDKSLIQRTASYTASDDRTVVWIGLPGYRYPGYQTAFWTPLPRHAWQGTSAADLLSADQSARAPLGWGPYAIDEWVAGERITLARNPNYWRGTEGLPYFSTLNFLFVEDPAAALGRGECDLALPIESADPVALQAVGAQIFYTPSGSWEHLDFGIAPLTYDGGFNLFQDRADYFGDVRMRQAIAVCIDRRALIDTYAFRQGTAPATYVQPGHPLFNGSAATHIFDPATANALLDELGWISGVDGVRVNQTYTGAVQGVPLQLTLYTGDSQQALGVAEIIRNSLDDCGIAIDVVSAPAEQTFEPGPSGMVFGRAFDLAQFAWPHGDQPACYLYLSEAAPGPDLNAYKYGWGGWNISGWSNPEYDAACGAALLSLPGEPGYGDAERQAQAIFAEQLPALPLFVPYEVTAARADFCGFSADFGSDLLQAIENYGYAEWCN